MNRLLDGYGVNKAAGQSLIEMTVIVAAVLLLVTGLIAGTTTSLKSSQYGRFKSRAVKFAQEGIELTRKFRSDGWSSFQARSGLWCLDGSSQWVQADPECPVNIDNTFTRTVNFVWDTTNERMEVTVTVSWNEGGTPVASQLVTYFTHWQ